MSAAAHAISPLTIMDTLQSKWAIPNHVEFVKGNGGLTKVVLKLEKGTTRQCL